MLDLGYDRRLVRVAISGGVLKGLITVNNEIPGELRCIEGIPDDATFICSTFNDIQQIAYLIFYHKDFDIVPIGDDIPIIRVRHLLKYVQK